MAVVEDERPRAVDIAKRFLEQGDTLISGQINWLELLPHLIKQDLIDREDQGFFLDNKRPLVDCLRCKFTKLEEWLRKRGRSAYTKFLQCVRTEKQHLGHSYVVAILEGRAFANEKDIRTSQQFKCHIRASMTLMMDINLDELVPLMLSRELVTQEESLQLLDRSEAVKKRILLLFDILDTKGPTAHLLFVQCLNQEHSHPTHSELYKKLTSNSEVVYEQNDYEEREERDKPDLTGELVSWLPKRHPIPLAMEGALKGRKYTKLMSTFKSYLHNGQWADLESKAVELECGVPDIQAVALLEVGVSWIFRVHDLNSKDVEDKVISYVDRARTISTRISGANSYFIEARCEHILALLYRYLKVPAQAKEHAEKSIYILHRLERGEDSSIASYLDGCTQMECLSVDSPRDSEAAKGIEFLLESAASDALETKSGQSVIAYQAILRLAQLHLCSSQDKPCSTPVTDRTSISKAEGCLSWIEAKLKQLPDRCRCLFYITKSDYFRNQGSYDKATELATSAFELATDHGFPRQCTFADSRIQDLAVITK